MLYQQTCIHIDDNSGVQIVRIFNKGIKKTKKSTNITSGNIVKGSVIQIQTNKKKMFKKQKVSVLILTTKKKYVRKSGIYINFQKNKAIVLSELKRRKPVANKVYFKLIDKLILRNKKNKLVFKMFKKQL